MHHTIVARALAARLGHRFVNLATIIAAIFFSAILLLMTAFAYFFSPWWWLLLVPTLFFLTLFFIIRLIAGFILSRIHVGKLSKEQRQGLDDFIRKVQRLLEARATPLPIVALVCLKDIVIHKDISTIKKIINDTVSLRRDYQVLEDLFN